MFELCRKDATLVKTKPFVIARNEAKTFVVDCSRLLSDKRLEMKWMFFLETNLTSIYHKWIASFLAMTRSDDRGESQELRRWRIPSFRRGGTAMTARGKGGVIKCE